MTIMIFKLPTMKHVRSSQYSQPTTCNDAIVYDGFGTIMHDANPWWKCNDEGATKSQHKL